MSDRESEIRADERAKCIAILVELDEQNGDFECPADALDGAKRIRVRLGGESCPDCREREHFSGPTRANLDGWLEGWELLAADRVRWVIQDRYWQPGHWFHDDEPGRSLRIHRETTPPGLSYLLVFRPWHPDMCTTCGLVCPDEMEAVIAFALSLP